MLPPLLLAILVASAATPTVTPTPQVRRFAAKPRPTVVELGREPGRERKSLSDLAKSIKITPTMISDRDVGHAAAPTDGVVIESAMTERISDEREPRFTYRVVARAAAPSMITLYLTWVDRDGLAMASKELPPLPTDSAGRLTITDVVWTDPARAARIVGLAAKVLTVVPLGISKDTTPPAARTMPPDAAPVPIP